MHGPRRVITFCLLTAVLPTVLLVIPLYLRHSVYADVSYEVTESDVLEMVEGISSVFCQEHSLKMNSTFSAFKLDGEPTLSPKRKHVHLKKSMSLPDDTLEYWGFYLLEGSSVVLTVCSRYDGGRIMLVRGERNLKTCGLLQHNSRRQKMLQGGGRQQPEGHNVRMMFERKSDRRLDDGLLSAEVEQVGSGLFMKEDLTHVTREDKDSVLMKTDGAQNGEEVEDEVWVEARKGRTGSHGNREVLPKGGVSEALDGLKFGGATKVKKDWKEDDNDRKNDDENYDYDDEDDDGNDEEEHSGQGEPLQNPLAFMPHSEEATELHPNSGEKGESGVILEKHLESLRHKKKLAKLEKSKLKNAEGDLETTKSLQKRAIDGHQGIGELRAKRLERLRRDLERVEDSGEEVNKRREKREDVRLVDTGLKHGGTAIGYIKRESEEDSESSFELGLKECYGGLIEHQQTFEPSASCTEEVASESTDINGAEESKNSLRFAYDIVESGYYYYIFYSDNDRVTNTMHAAFDIHKSVYEYESEKTVNGSEKCINATECTFSIGFLSGAIVMVEIPHRDGIDRDVNDEVGGPQGALLISSCHPRMSVYIVFPIAVLFLILGCAFL